jgi:hypothetical protein
LIRNRTRGALAALCLTAAAFAAPGAANAATMSDSYSTSLSSGSVNIGGYHLGGGVIGKLATLDLDVTAKATWTGNLSTALAWNSANVRSGGELPIGRTTPPLWTGNLHVTWQATGNVDTALTSPTDIGVKLFSDDASCAPSLILNGTAYDCVATSPSVALVQTPGIPGSPYVKVSLKARFTITPEAGIVSSSFSVGGTTVRNASGLLLLPIPVVDTPALPCGTGGQSVSYRLGATHWTPAVSVTQQPTVTVGQMDPVLGLAELPALYDKAFGQAAHSNPAFDLTGAGHTTNSGVALPDGPLCH